MKESIQCWEKVHKEVFIGGGRRNIVVEDGNITGVEWGVG